MLCLILQNTISTSETSIQNKNTKCSGSKQGEAKAKQAKMKEMAHRKEDNHDMTIKKAEKLRNRGTQRFFKDT